MCDHHIGEMCGREHGISDLRYGRRDDGGTVKTALGGGTQIRRLQARGWGNRFSKIYTAKNGQEAVDIIFQYRPEVMLLDIQMPKKGGLEVMKEAKEGGVCPETIILSGYDEFSYAQQAIRYGARDYMLKPCRSTDILKKLLDIADEIEGFGGGGERIPDLGGDCPQAVSRAKEYIEEHYAEEITLQKVANVVGISPGYLSTLFAQYLGCGFVDHLIKIRVEHACDYLRQNYFKTYEIAYKIGYRDEKYFARVFKKVTGMSPGEYRKSRDRKNVPAFFWKIVHCFGKSAPFFAESAEL